MARGCFKISRLLTFPYDCQFKCCDHLSSLVFMLQPLTVFHFYHLNNICWSVKLYKSSLENIPCPTCWVCFPLLGPYISGMSSHILNPYPSLLWYVSFVWFCWMKLRLPKNNRRPQKEWLSLAEKEKRLSWLVLISKWNTSLTVEETTAISRNIWPLDVDWNSCLT